MKAILLFLWCATLAAGQKWTVRTVNIIPRSGRIDEGIKAGLRIDATALLCEAKKAQLCAIPVSAITGLSHDHRFRNRAAEYSDSMPYGNPLTCHGYSCGADLVIMGGLAPFSVHWEYVTIHWRDNGTPRITVLRFGKTDFPSFQRELSSRTGLVFEDTGALRDATIKQIELRKGEALPLRFDRAIFIRNEVIPRGLYQILVVEREPAAGDLYFFRGKKVVSNRPELIVPVSILGNAEYAIAAEPEYSTRAQWRVLERIRMRGRIVQIMP
jgi:hypothetical protein